MTAGSIPASARRASTAVRSAPGPVGQRVALPVGGRGGGGRLPPLPALPARNRAVFQRLDRQPGDRRAGAAAHRRGGRARSGGRHRGAPGRAPRRGVTAADATVRAASPGQSGKGGQDRARAARQTPPRRDQPAHDRDRDARGLRSLRRFNSVFVEVYGRPPSQVRRPRGAGRPPREADGRGAGQVAIRTGTGMR